MSRTLLELPLSDDDDDYDLVAAACAAQFFCRRRRAAPHKQKRLPQYQEYCDSLEEEGQTGRAGGRNNVRSKVREAIRKQLAASGRDRPNYNKRRNLIV